MSIVIPEYVPLSPDLYFIAIAQIWVRPWVKNAQSGLMEKGTGNFIPVGDCDEFKTSFATERLTRFARDQRRRVKALDKIIQTELNASWIAMQHSGFNRALALQSSLVGMDQGPATAPMPIGEVQTAILETVVINVGEQGPEGALLFHRWEGGPDGDFMWGGGTELSGMSYAGGVVSIPPTDPDEPLLTGGIGVWCPKGVLLPGQEVPAPEVP